MDYIALLPSEFYEPGVLELSVSKPCIPENEKSDDLCLMYTHIDISQFFNVIFTDIENKKRLVKKSMFINHSTFSCNIYAYIDLKRQLLLIQIWLFWMETACPEMPKC